MEGNELTTSDLAVLESLHTASDAVSQRELARRTGFSVGLVNAVIQKLVRTGYVKTAHLNRKQFEYLLTAQGFARAAAKSYHYIVDTAHRYRDIQLKLRAVLNSLSVEGVTEFYLYGDDELAELVATFFAEDRCSQLRRGLPPEGNNGNTAVLNASPKPLKNKGWRVVDLVKLLGNGGSMAKEAPSK